MASLQLVGTKEFASRSNGLIAVKQVTTDAGGAATVAHGMTNEDGSGKTPVVAFAFPEDGLAIGATFALTVTSTNLVIAGGGNAVKWTVVAFG